MSQELPINRTPTPLSAAPDPPDAGLDSLWGLASCRRCQGLVDVRGAGRPREFGPQDRRRLVSALGRRQLAEMAAAAPTRRGLREAGRLAEPRFAGDPASPREHDCHEIEAAISVVPHCDCPACRGESAPEPAPPPPAPPRYAWLDKVLKEWIVFRRKELAEHYIEVRLDFSLAAPMIWLASGGITESLMVAAPAHKAGEFDAIVATAIDAALTRLLALVKDRGGEP